MTTATLKMAMAALADPNNNATDVARHLGLTRTTLYAYVNGDGSAKEVGQRLLDAEQSKGTRVEKRLSCDTGHPGPEEMIDPITAEG